MMAAYCYYLGHRRHVENQIKQVVPPSLLRCPFVMGILSKHTPFGQGGQPPETITTMASPTMAAGKQGWVDR
jgi:hypothetical protein